MVLMVCVRSAVMSVVYQRLTALGPGLPGPAPMICSGVRGTAGGWTSKTTPVSAIRLLPSFSPVPRRFSKILTRCPGAMVRRRRASGRIATPFPSAEITSGRLPAAGRDPGWPGPRRCAWQAWAG